VARRTLADIDNEVKARMSNRTDISSTQRGFFIQDAYFAIANYFDHVQLQGLGDETLNDAADTLTPATLTDIWYPEILRNVTDGRPIVVDSKDNVERIFPKSSGPPYKFYWWAGTFVFDTLANGAKTIRVWYKKKPVEFTTTSVLDQIFDPLIIIEAARIGLDSVNDYDESARLMRSFDEYVIRRKLPVHQARLNDYRTGFRVRVK
jgi:hypothetical protein